VLLHAVSVYAVVFHADGLHIDFFSVASLFGLVTAGLCTGFSLYRPVINLTLIAYPVAILAIAGSAVTHSSHVISNLSKAEVAHILLSVLAYSVLTLGTAQAAVLYLQNYQLRNRPFNALFKTLPPLQTMEGMLFEMLAVGWLLLGAAIITGFIFFEDLFAQHLVHKTVLSIIAWVLYSIVLTGHYLLGWRGNVAIRFTLGGFVALALAYFGSKFVLEIVLHRV
jgi:ABC-type uncharacterized transport system permease subunit